MDAIFSEPLTNAACMGYIIMALENLDYRDEQIWQVITEMKELFDWVSIEEAQVHYSEGSYYVTPPLDILSRGKDAAKASTSRASTGL